MFFKNRSFSFSSRSIQTEGDRLQPIGIKFQGGCLHPRFILLNFRINFIAMENKFVSAVAGGIAGTAVITGMMLLLSFVGMPDINYGTMLAGFTQTSPLLGWVMHFIMGIVLAFIYVYFFRDEISFPYAMRGLIYSVLPWAITLIMLFPMMGLETGLSGKQSPGIFILSTMIAYLAYGFVMGAIARPHAIRNVTTT